MGLLTRASLLSESGKGFVCHSYAASLHAVDDGTALRTLVGVPLATGDAVTHAKASGRLTPMVGANTASQLDATMLAATPGSGTTAKVAKTHSNQ